MAHRRADRSAVRAWIGKRTQNEAAAILGASQQHLSAYLRGDRELSFGVMALWAGITEIPVETFTRARVDSAA